MKIKYACSIVYSVLTLVVANIATTNAQDTTKPELPEVTITHHKKLISTDDGVKMEKGKYTVFEIKTVHGGDPRVDAQVTTTLIFDIARGIKSFEINSDEWKERLAYVLISECRCMDRGYNPIVSGILKGKKLADGKWQIEADVVAEGIDSGEDRIFRYSGVIPSEK
ncbi:hypothetical protein LVD17_21345 [Fulvivirga ulvae]|uniref:hypothetical protein n=1 Tax=Fulvivirga ulvae TaxID=2904245 RepID=UPI001F444EB7|nr:hypothetical protein [Fulvivirga ulvae]UII30842.1 hypothetical protein LVD17_21345 [Fulvivirga ulvae]